MGTIYNRSYLTPRRRELRNRLSRAEIYLWSRVKNKQILGYKFRRQYSVGNFVVDFYCPKLKLAIEVDGPSHFTKEAREYDKNREEYIKSFGIRFLRVTNLDVYRNMEGVIDKIIEIIKKSSHR
ncbi:MAG: endonuclease domain-containing protein [Patescibacteria group bacterium]